MADSSKPKDDSKANTPPPEKHSDSKISSASNRAESRSDKPDSDWPPKGNVAYTRGWEPGDPIPPRITVVDGVAHESEPSETDSNRNAANSNLSEEDKRFLESDFAKDLLASPGFQRILENQKRAADIARAAVRGRDEIKNAAHDPLASVSDEIEERRAMQDLSNEAIAGILERDESEHRDASKPGDLSDNPPAEIHETPHHGFLDPAHKLGNLVTHNPKLSFGGGAGVMYVASIAIGLSGASLTKITILSAIFYLIGLFFLFSVFLEAHLFQNYRVRSILSFTFIVAGTITLWFLMLPEPPLTPQDYASAVWKQAPQVSAVEKEPKLRGEILQSAFLHAHNGESHIWLQVRVYNTGAPTIVRGWRLRARSPKFNIDRQPMILDADYIYDADPAATHEGRIVFRPSDGIYEKAAREPLVAGKDLVGWLLYVIPEIDIDTLGEAGTEYKIIVSDYLSNPYELETFTLSGQPASPSYYSGGGHPKFQIKPRKAQPQK